MSRAMTLLETVVAMAVLSVLAALMASAFLPAQRMTAETTVYLDMDRDARRLLDRLRRDLRSSGFKADGTQQFSLAPSGEQLSLRRRLGPGAADDTTSAAPTPGWSTEIEWELVADGTWSSVPGALTRYALRRSQDGAALDVVSGAQALSLVHDESGGVGADTIVVTLTLARPFPYPSGGVPTLVSRTYTDRVQLLNRRPN